MTTSGTTRIDGGIRFTLASLHATSVTLCLFDSPADEHPVRTIPVERQDEIHFAATVEGVEAGALYGYRVDGPDDPARGHRFSPAAILVDPYARALCGPDGWRDRLLGPDPTLPPRAVVIDADADFDWQGDIAPQTPWRDTVIYECHVGTLTHRHPDVPPELRGTYLGLASDAVIAHLRRIGVTAVELLPVAASLTEGHLAGQARSNLWGYSTLAFGAPDARFASDDRGAQVDEFRRMVRKLHAAGIEVILDVVFNHTAEGGADGPALSLRGIDNAAYYRHLPDNPALYEDWTGCGNTLDVNRPLGRTLVLDLLRRWVEEMHVDGFRFDLAAALARDPGRPNGLSELIESMSQDPVLSRVKRIAEPWDLGPGGGFQGRFPVGWAEWNDRFRDDARSFWLHDDSRIGAVATRIAGSSDLYAAAGRSPQAGISMVTAHDGFTLADLVAYNHKHNEDNGEDNRDGSDHNLSHNHGIEGPTDDADVLSRRARSRRNLLATLYLSCGVPMVLAGDEIGRSQSGNNNGYCLDPDAAAVPFDVPPDPELLDFVRRLAEIRQAWPVLRTDRFFSSEPGDDTDVVGLTWLRPDGAAMTAADWDEPDRHAVAALLRDHGRRSLLLLNGGTEPIHFALPVQDRWELILQTTAPRKSRREVQSLELAERSLAFVAAIGSAGAAASPEHP